MKKLKKKKEFSAKRSDGAISHQRVQQHWNPNVPFRILCIDGGGIKGIFPATLLSIVEQELLNSESIGTHVDMICGTSTGGIIAIGLGLGISGKTISDLYLEKGDIIFPSTWKKGAFGSKHNRKALDDELGSVFGDRLFGECIPRMVIPSFDQYVEPNIDKTDHHSDYKMDWKKTAVAVASATSAAPVYLSAYLGEESIQWDGGLFANHPIMNGLVDALACYDVDRTNIEIVSLGCGKNKSKITEDPKGMASAGFLKWAEHLVPTASTLQLHDSYGQACLLIGKHKIIRIDPTLKDVIDLDDVIKAKKYLPELAARVFEEHKESLTNFFLPESSLRERHYSSTVEQ